MLIMLIMRQKIVLQVIYECFDLVISNYAFSELNSDLQNIYYTKLLKKVSSGILHVILKHILGTQCK